MSSRTPIAGSPDDPPTAEIQLLQLRQRPSESSAPRSRSDGERSAIRGRVLFVASVGGHLAELNRLSAGFDADPSSVWVTFDCEQSRSILAGRDVRFVPYVSPRDLVGTLRATRRILALMRRERFDVVVSTGAAVALSAFLAARIRCVPSIYIESVARVSGPSMTGRLTAALHLAQLRTQHSSYADDRWRLHDSALSGFRTVPSPEDAMVRPRLLVTLGTIRPYRFDALIDAVLATGMADERTIWQVGVTTRSDLPGRVVEQLPHDALLRAAEEADVVITHAGVGTVLELLEQGLNPIVVPRSAHRGEHVDDHQAEIARFLRSVHVASVLEVEDVTADRLAAAAAFRVVTVR